MPDVRVSRLPRATIAGVSNASYWLHFGLRSVPDGSKVKSEHNAAHFARTCAVPASSLYEAHFSRWKRGLERRDMSCTHRQLATDGRLFIGVSNASLFETSIGLDPTYCVPVIRGEACKGLARRAARRLLPDALFKAMFGTSDSDAGIGMVRFLDALWVPDSAPEAYTQVLKWVYGDLVREHQGQGLSAVDGKRHPLVREIVNPHHPDFTAHGTRRATPFDEPKPVAMLAAHGSFLFATQGHELWRNHALDLLAAGLTQEGIGARTPEYGRFLPPVPATRQGR